LEFGTWSEGDRRRARKFAVRHVQHDLLAEIVFFFPHSKSANNTFSHGFLAKTNVLLATALLFSWVSTVITVPANPGHVKFTWESQGLKRTRHSWISAC
jgi:hypothetical protein